MKVGDSFRTNRLSLKDGGVTVRVIYHDHIIGPKIRDYDKIKNSQAYIRATLRNPDVKSVFVLKDNK